MFSVFGFPPVSAFRRMVSAIHEQSALFSRGLWSAVGRTEYCQGGTEGVDAEQGGFDCDHRLGHGESDESFRAF